MMNSPYLFVSSFDKAALAQALAIPKNDSSGPFSTHIVLELDQKKES